LKIACFSRVTCQPSVLEWWGLAILAATAVIAIAPANVSAQTNTQIDARTRQAMVDAINDEYCARAFYTATIAKFGQVRPFSNIVWAKCPVCCKSNNLHGKPC
jgi:hypothetical protein